MKRIPFTKLHGDENDFLLTWAKDAPRDELNEIAKRICQRNTGIGADGWMLIWPDEGLLRTRLFNSDGSEPEMSGNGTRCAAALAIQSGMTAGPDVIIATAAGHKHLKLISRSGLRFLFEMDMGKPVVEELRARLELNGAKWDATILNVGNPQCAIFVKNLPDTWRMAAAEAERHSRFPRHSNVSFVRVLDRHAIEVVFYERGAEKRAVRGRGPPGPEPLLFSGVRPIAPLPFERPRGVYPCDGMRLFI